MKKIIIFLLFIIIFTVCSSFTIDDEIININNKVFSIDKISSTEKKFKSESIETCGIGSVKSYMDYRAITDTASRQYKYIQENMIVDNETGFLYDEEGFIGAALGRYYGVIGDKFYFTLENGVILPIVKIESKADVDTDDKNCYNPYDNSTIEFVVDTDKANEYFGYYGNGLVLSGNYGNYPLFKGKIISVEKVLDEKVNEESTYNSSKQNNNDNLNVFYYASGY